MIRTLVKPDKQSISIILPENFIGKQVEVIAFTVDEATSVPESQATYVASEKVLAKDWLTAEDDLAWQDL
ncbi:hypothetical protein ACFQ3S_06335 [Mucilaginibacter terrae]|uniref:hypothetical protein n=1 Tax=Mucilaginibacter terrae TaxID=1955052 RepID=UPI00363A787F